MKMSETNGNGTMAEHIADGNIEPVMKKPRIDESVEERDFDEETQKALEEIDANQNEIDALNEREFCLELLQYCLFKRFDCVIETLIFFDFFFDHPW